MPGGASPANVTIKKNNPAKKMTPQLLEDLSWAAGQDWWEECTSWFPCSTDPCLQQLLLPQPEGVQISSSSAFPDIAQFLFTASGLVFSKDGARCLFLQETRCVNSSINISSKPCSSTAERASGDKPRAQEPRKENTFKEYA